MRAVMLHRGTAWRVAGQKWAKKKKGLSQYSKRMCSAISTYSPTYSGFKTTNTLSVGPILCHSGRKTGYEYIKINITIVSR